MHTIYLLIQKEFRQVFRNRSLLPLIFVVPLVQLLILPLAATFETKGIRLQVLDADHSPQSRALTRHFAASPFFHLVDAPPDARAADDAMMRGLADATLTIPPHFEADLLRSDAAKIHLSFDAVNSTTAGLANTYSLAIINDFNRTATATASATAPRFWYNPQLDYPTYMVPAILVLLVTIIGLFLSSVNMVREKETGTIEQINVTPIRKYQFIIGKFVPFWIFALVDATLGLLLARYVYGVPIVGSLALIYLLLIVFLLAVLGVGLFFSAISSTQQQAMFMAWFFMMIFILLSGIFTPTESMPEWAQRFNLINPFAHGIRAIRMIMLKGAAFADVRQEFYALLIYGSLALTLAINRYKKMNS
ncbi:MAG: ABC transporter permease [Prevotellaceae bacterium]|jgi:ABC-2 type transport system permease protein|nr:ABC transporter permease [Prevotellaceae bacterium]